MSLKPSNQSAAITQADSKITWPVLELPMAHPVFGATADINDALQKHYSAVQGAVNKRLDAMSATIRDQAAQINTLKSAAG